MVIVLPADSPEPKIPEDLGNKITYKKPTEKKPPSLEISQDHGQDPAELAEELFPEHEEARKVLFVELSAKRIPVRDEDIKPSQKNLKALKEKIRWSKPTKDQDGEIWIASDIGMEPQEIADKLFPEDDAGQTLILGALQ